MKALDLFCGLGGWSDGLAMEGFKVLGVEIEPKIAELYKHPCLVADVRELDGRMFRTFDLIVGSPPCRDFCIFAKRFGKTWKKNPPNPDKGLELVNAFLRIVNEVKPKVWLMENVPALCEYIQEKPKTITYLGDRSRNSMRRAFWGEFPPFLIPYDGSRRVMRYRSEVQKSMKEVYSGKYSKWERAKIPLPVARALGKAVKEQMKEGYAATQK